jgi:hypothetical protein
MNDPVAELHREIDAVAGRLAELHQGRLACRRGCSGCCVDDITVHEVEADRIRADNAELLAHGTPGPAGACAFLDGEGACRIYASRPYVCRTQGLPLRWLDGDAEHRDICSLNEAGPPITELPREACWPIGPAEAKLHVLQERLRGRQARVRLRELFAPR